VTKRKTGRRATDTAGRPTVRATIDAFLDAQKIKSNANTLRAYASVLDRIADQLDADCALADAADTDMDHALTGLWGETKPATCNRNGAVVGSWLAGAPTSSTGPRRSYPHPPNGRFARDHPDIVHAKVNTDAERELAATAGIRTIPTTMAFREGILVYSRSGAMPPVVLKNLIDRVKGLDMTTVRAKIVSAKPPPRRR
jgi:thioredoxin reductase (NADPH)